MGAASQGQDEGGFDANAVMAKRGLRLWSLALLEAPRGLYERQAMPAASPASGKPSLARSELTEVVD